MCFTALAELCDLFAKRADPEDALLLWERREMTLRDIVVATKRFTEEDINYLDPFMGASFFYIILKFNL